MKFWFRSDREQLARIELLLSKLLELQIAEMTVCSSGDRGTQLERRIGEIRRMANK
jgi:hypothetical protein